MGEQVNVDNNNLQEKDEDLQDERSKLAELEEDEKKEEFDAGALFAEMGGWSRWHSMMYFVVNFINLFFVAYHSLSIVFVGMSPSVVHCRLPPGTDPSDAIPLDDDGQLSQCRVYDNYSAATNTTRHCDTGWTYSSDVYTIVNQWNLVCDKEHWSNTVELISIIGAVIIGNMFSMTSDIVGRKPMCFLAFTLAIFFSAVSTCVTSFGLFIFITFLRRGCVSGVVFTGYVLTCECMPDTSRGRAVILTEVFYAAGMMALALFAYLFPDWRNLTLVTSLPYLLLLLTWPLVTESPQWLMMKGRRDEMVALFKKVAKFNNTSLPPSLKKYANEEFRETFGQAMKKHIHELKKHASKKKDTPNEKHKETIVDLLKSRTTLLYLGITSFLNLTLCFVYFGVTYNTGSIAGDIYLNFFLSGVVELPSLAGVAICLNFFGRKPITMVSFSICSIALFGLLAIDQLDMRESLMGLEMTLAMIGRLAITGAFMVAILFCTECFPTTLRSSALGFAFIGGRIGNLLAPYTPFVAKRYPWLPHLVFGALSLLCVFAVSLLPETRGRALPVTIAEVESWTNKPTERDLKISRLNDHGNSIV